MAKRKSPNYLQQMFHAFLVKRLKSWGNAKRWAAKNQINENTMHGVWYRPDSIGLNIMDTILSKLLKLSPKKVADLEDCLNQFKPISESAKIWNSLKIPESERLRLAYIAKFICEVESKVRKK